VRPSPITLLSAALLSGSIALPATAADDTARDTAAPSEADISDFEVEVIRPGIDRVLDDGADHPIERVRRVAVAPDGRVWAATADGTVFAVGEAGSFDPETHGLPSPVGELAVLADGTVVVHDGRQIATWDGSTWLREGALADGRRGSIGSIVPADGGEYWVLLGPDEGPDGHQLAQLGPDDDEFFTLGDLGLDPDEPAWLTSLARTPDGAIWLGLRGVDGLPPVGLLRFDGESWSPVDPLGDGEPFSVWETDVGADGALTALVSSEGRRYPSLARWHGDAWTLAPAIEGFAAGTTIPGSSEWPAQDWLRWAPSAGAIDYAFPGPFTEARVTDTAAGPDGSMWAVLTTSGNAPLPGRPKAGLYRIDTEAAAASLPEYRTAGRHGLVPLLHPRFATAGGGDGNKRAKWAQRQGTDVVAEVFAVGDRWYAGLDSVGRQGDRWIKRNSIGTGSSPMTAIKDALRKEKRVTFVGKAARSALFEWPSPPPRKKN